MKLKKLFSYALLLLITVGVVVFCIDYYVKKKTEAAVYTQIEEVPYNRVGLLLGTGKYLSNGGVNLYYQYRIDAAVELYKAGKITYVLISGDNGSKDYNEPMEMKADLKVGGIPEDHIFLDYAGFSTLDSVVRCKEIFGQDKITVISQRFHNERAIYLAASNDIQAVGFNAKDVSVNYGFITMQREKLARCKMMLDLLFGSEPKFGGEKIEIP
ncbi:protein SanA [Neptunitalea chrysea]|uniref:Protein SanA n=1 Tax=Neptunitalea chrysea TaxID=1647581 RepID=A0A9W6ETD5_9FLAO|nr:ElyC/SanA/YdcF family protein [Neptunitalea chrysea]GLB51785.1 protein SanA [Neptunitalea chrysea]